ncbi:MAG: hypothetical protein HYZ29_23795 [Myxococcales bacterium]|nr:hypothetical protein [Myxococcales bacterium]
MKRVLGCCALVALMGATVPALADEPGGRHPTPEPAANATDEKGAEEEEEPPISFTVEAAVATSYVWRGFLLSTKLMKPVFQPYAEVSVNQLGPGALAVGVWMNKALTKEAGLDDSPLELDPYLAYTLPVGPVELKLGYTAYLYPTHDDYGLEKLDGGHEFGVQGTFDLGLPISPYACVFVEPVRWKGVYAAAGVNHTLEAGAFELATTLNFGVGMYKYEDGADDDQDFGLQDITLSTKGTYSFGESGLYAAATLAAAYPGVEQLDEDGNKRKLLPYGLLAVGFGL